MHRFHCVRIARGVIHGCFSSECEVFVCIETCSVRCEVVTLSHRARRGGQGGATRAAGDVVVAEPLTPPEASAGTPKAWYLERNT